MSTTRVFTNSHYLRDFPVKGKTISAIWNALKCETFALLSYNSPKYRYTLVGKYRVKMLDDPLSWKGLMCGRGVHIVFIGMKHTGTDFWLRSETY